jgi:hypothetical protein
MQSFDVYFNKIKEQMYTCKKIYVQNLVQKEKCPNIKGTQKRNLSYLIKQTICH